MAMLVRQLCLLLVACKPTIVDSHQDAHQCDAGYYLSSSGCVTCPPYPNSPPGSASCRLRLADYLPHMANPVIHASNNTDGSVRLSVQPTVLPMNFVEEMNFSYTLDITPAAQDLNSLSSCNAEWRHSFEGGTTVDDFNGWSDSRNDFLQSVVNRVHGPFDRNVPHIEKRFEGLRPSSRARLSMRLITLDAFDGGDKHVFINVNEVEVFRADSCGSLWSTFSVDSVGGSSRADCYLDSAVDVNVPASGTLTVRIGSTQDGISSDESWAFQNLELYVWVPTAEADFTYSQLNEPMPCILGVEQSDTHIIRTGFVGVFLIANSRVVYEQHVPLKIFFPRASVGTYSMPINIWLPYVAPELKHDAEAFRSTVQLYYTSTYTNVETYAVYKEGTTIFAVHSLTSVELPLEVKTAFLSLSSDPTNSSAFQQNVTIEQGVGGLGFRRFSFQATVCPSCTLHVLSIVSSARRLKEDPMTRRLQVEDGYALTSVHFSVAEASSEDTAPSPTIAVTVGDQETGSTIHPDEVLDSLSVRFGFSALPLIAVAASWRV